MSTSKKEAENGQTRRDFIVLSAGAVAGVGGLAAAWPLVSSLSPSADVLALSSSEVDVSSIQPGQSIRIMWRGKPVFIRRRTKKEIEEAKSVSLNDLPDPQSDSDRIKKDKEEWLIVVGICTHLGCVPLGNSGDYGGWFCPCHGSHYDTSGRIRKGPAPTNLAVPPYRFTSDNIVKIG